MKKIGIIVVSMLVLVTGCANHVKDGTELLEAKKYEDAIEAFEKDIENEEHLDEAYRGVGIAYFELEDFEAAAKAFEEALQNGAEETATLYGLMGACYVELGQYEDAVEVYKKALEKEDISADLKQQISFNLIGVYEAMYEWDAAKLQMEEYVKEYPDDNRVKKEAEFLETR